MWWFILHICFKVHRELGVTLYQTPWLPPHLLSVDLCEPARRRPLDRLLIPHRHQLAHDEILVAELVLPPLERLELVGRQIRQLVERAVEVLGQHLLVEAAARESARRVPAGKVGVGPAGPVEAPAARDVKDAAPHGEVHGLVVLAVERQEGAWCEDLEDGGVGVGGGDVGRRRSEEGVSGPEEEAEEDEIEGGEKPGWGG